MYGMYGAAVATAVSLALSNIIRVAILNKKLKILPFDLSSLKLSLPFALSIT